MGKKIFFFLAGILIVVILSSETILSPFAEKKEDAIEKSESLPLAEVSVADPVELTWKTLSDVQFKDVYVPELDAYYWKPTFGQSIKALEGKEVFITGYVIPVDYDANFYVASKFPYANCFFCGGGGPESVIDLRFATKPKTYKTDEHLAFKGKLKLNYSDVYSMTYILEGATPYLP